MQAMTMLRFLVLSLCCLVVGGATKSEYLNPGLPIPHRINKLLSRMTLSEKIGQMVQIERSVASAEVMKQYKIGSVLSGGGSVPSQNASPQEWIKMVNEFQKGAMSTRLKIPMLYGIDAVHGHNNVYNATIFPHNIALGATRDPDLVRRIGDATALEVRATGVNYAFAPCIAVCRDPRWGRCYESYGEDPEIVKNMTDIILGLQGEIPPRFPQAVPHVDGPKKVAACAKHFVGDGGTYHGIDEGNTMINWDTMLRIHMPGFVEAIQKGVSTIMASYSSWNGLKMHANHDLITNYLKNTLNFKGFVISDWEALDRITDPPHANYTYSVLEAVNAGIDMVMVPYNYTEFINTLTYLVKNKYVPMSRIDDAVGRILGVKFHMGLFEKPMADNSLVSELGKNDHRELAREAVRKSLVLLKNGEDADTPVLPLPKKGAKILVTGSHANNLGYQCGGWTISWQGQGGNNITKGTTILQGIMNTVHSSTEIVFNERANADFVKKNNFDYAILLVGEMPYAEIAGDSRNLTIAGNEGVITDVCINTKCVVVVISGRPVVMEPFVRFANAIVAAWLPGTEGQGVADVLFGDYGFTGKLPQTWFKSPDQLPMNVGDPHYDPLFPFGFGLETQPVQR
ncbi:uncharacterized protein LOC114746938 [Neltuma alba]|uniref:uncharacterized protein LOC114746938 n=1 Tax=Neltuma alba TaxID=207710 RepID=UPI0010A5A0A4|nr:uncharacterized protein LOC114746938 [Prosopis alba]